MLDVPHRGTISPRLERLIARRGGIVPPETGTLEEWSFRFRQDLRLLKLSERTNNVIARAAMVTTTRSEYEPSQRWTVDKDVQPYIPNPEAFGVAGRRLTFREWVRAIQLGRIKADDLIVIRNFGSKSLRELLEAIDRFNPQCSTEQIRADMAAAGGEMRPRTRE